MHVSQQDNAAKLLRQYKLIKRPETIRHFYIGSLQCTRFTFSQQDLDKLNARELSDDSCIRVQDTYFKPTARPHCFSHGLRPSDSVPLPTISVMCDAAGQALFGAFLEY